MGNTLGQDLTGAFIAVEAFVKKEIKGAEVLIAKGIAIEQNILPQLEALKAEAVELYKAAKAAEPVVIEVVQAIATIVADLTAAGI